MMLKNLLDLHEWVEDLTMQWYCVAFRDMIVTQYMYYTNNLGAMVILTALMGFRDRW